jgi:hypothetical protein
MNDFFKNNKKKLIIVASILLLIIGITTGLNQWKSYKYKTGYGLTNTEKSQNIKIAVLAKQYDKALELCDNYYEDNESIRFQWKNKIEKCKNEGINKFMLEDSLDNIK